VKRFVDRTISLELNAIIVEAEKLVELVLEVETSTPMTCVSGEYKETEVVAVTIVSAPDT
jgi:hypothetical protein